MHIRADLMPQDSRAQRLVRREPHLEKVDLSLHNYQLHLLTCAVS